MARQAPITQSTMSINARVQETGGPQGGAQLFQGIAADLKQRRDNYQAQATENAYLQGTTTLARDIERIESEHKNDPDTLSEALDEYSTGFLDEINDPNMTARYQLQIEKASQSAIARATANRNAIISEQARFENLQAFETMKGRLPNIARGLLSQDDAIAAAAGEEMQELLQRGTGMLGAIDPDGQPLFNAAFRVNQLVDMKDMALQSAVGSWLENQPDKEAALKVFENGELTINLPNAEGGVDQINVRDSVSPQTASLIHSAAKTQIAEQKAYIQQQRNLAASNIELAIETAFDDIPLNPAAMGPQLPSLTKGEKLNFILQQIDNNPLYNDSPEGIIKGNDLRKKVFSKLEKERDKFDQIQTGSAFASGEAFLNRGDSKAVDAYNKYYEAIEPNFANVEPFERNIAITSIVDNAKAVPDRLTGDIQRIARSNDVKQITQVADLIDRIGAQNPHLVADLAPQKDLARLQMINDKINSGYAPEEALEKVDYLLDPRNAPTTEQAAEEIKALKIDYRGDAIQAFDSAGWFKELITLGGAVGIDINHPAQKPTLDGLTAKYRKEFEDHYSITRDVKASKNHAKRVVQGQYGVTGVNGSDQIMLYPPEKYYGIVGADNKWMREQMIEDAQKSFENTLSPPTKKELRENLYLMIDPFNTPRTASQGAPEYVLMYKRKDGSLIKVEEKPYFFDPAKQRRKMVERAQKIKEIGQSGMDSLDQLIAIERLKQ